MNYKQVFRKDRITDLIVFLSLLVIIFDMHSTHSLVMYFNTHIEKPEIISFITMGDFYTATSVVATLYFFAIFEFLVDIKNYFSQNAIT